MNVASRDTEAGMLRCGGPAITRPVRSARALALQTYSPSNAVIPVTPRPYIICAPLVDSASVCKSAPRELESIKLWLNLSRLFPLFLDFHLPDNLVDGNIV